MEVDQPALATLNGAQTATQSEAHLAQTDGVQSLFRLGGAEECDGLRAASDDERLTGLGSLGEFGEVVPEDPDAEFLHGAEDTLVTLVSTRGFVPTFVSTLQTEPAGARPASSDGRSHAGRGGKRNWPASI